MSPSQNPARPKPRRPPRPTTARGPRFGVVISLAFHAAILGATYFTWHKVIETHEESHAVPVDLVTIAETTNVAAMAPPQPPPKVDIPPPQIDQPALPDFADVEPSPEPPVPEFKIKPEKSTDQDQPKTNKKQVQDMDALLNKILAPQKTPKNAKAGPRVVQGIGNQNLMTADLADYIKSKIRGCLNTGALMGAPNHNDLVVDIELQLNPDGTVSGRPQLSGNSAMAAGSNPYTRAAAEAINRAIYECQPYKLPADRYNQWRDISMHFDPSDMMGQ